ncbi:MAG: hypothetical protein K2W81_13180, partial [Sphingomonas sp.]|uniref:hypothetical protein n=1 Tax=Sphingomonas sp. TaxID=28214 RepID=UPI0025E7CA4C
MVWIVPRSHDGESIRSKVMHSTDLKALADWLRPQRRHLKFVGLVDRVAALGTISEDLRECGRCLNVIERMQDRNDLAKEKLSREDDATITGALFSQAIILYARATAQGGNNRMALLNDSDVPASLRATHKRIQKLRSEAIAHYGTGEKLLGTPLVREAVVFSFQRTETGVREQTNILTTRAQHKVDVSHQLRTLVAAQLDRIERIKDAELGALRAELEAAVKADTNLGGVDKFEPVSGGGDMDHAEEAFGE